MSGSECPTSDRLRGYVLGELPEDELDAISVHLHECPPCLEKAGSAADGFDPVLAALRRPAELQAPADPAYQRALAKVLTQDVPDEKPAQTAPLGPGSLLREYLLQERLGQGGMGTVYRALHTRIEKDVALKVLSPKRMHDPDALARFEREMRAAGRFRHPHIVQATDAGEADGVHFLVMEYVPGVDLAGLVKRYGPLGLADSCELIRQAAVGLHHAHINGLIHRDIKPSNLRLTPEGDVKILDLGLALFRGEQHLPASVGGVSPSDATAAGGEFLTSASHVLGTNEYMAPEQWQDAHAVDARADIYGLGCTLWYLLTGRPPARMNAGRVPLHVHRQDIPAALEHLIYRMLSELPAGRPISGEQAAEELLPFAAGAELPALLGIVDLSAASKPNQSTVRTERPVAKSGKRLRTAAISLAAVVLVACGLWASIGGGGRVGSPSGSSEIGSNPPPAPEAGRIPMSDAQAQAVQQEWADYLECKTRDTNGSGIEFVLIPPGEVNLDIETRASLTKPYWLSATEVTRGQFREFVRAKKHITDVEANGLGGSIRMPPVRAGNNTISIPRQHPKQIWETPGYPIVTDDHPVTQVSWRDANFYCAWLTSVDGRTYRLPTEAEWLWAARAGAATQFPGEGRKDDDASRLGDFAWIANNCKQPQPVKRRTPNAWGLYDALGNVEEWCSDWYGPFVPGLLTDPQGPPTGTIRATRGGGYFMLPTYTSRAGGLPESAMAHIGFRVLREQ